MIVRAVRGILAPMSREEFIAKWRGTTRTERTAAQEHFLDLCALLGVSKPADIDRHGIEYTFEKSTRKIGDTQGFADVWWRGRFAAEGFARPYIFSRLIKGFRLFARHCAT